MALNRGACFVDLLERSPLQEYIDDLLGATCVIHSYNTMCVLPGERSHARNIHRDSPRFSAEYRLSMQILYMLSEFTEDNGATRVLVGGHNAAERPTDDYFWRRSVPLCGAPGDAVIFDSMLWHAGGANRTASPRYAATIVYTRSFMKQQFDLPRATSPRWSPVEPARSPPARLRCSGAHIAVRVPAP